MDESTVVDDSLDDLDRRIRHLLQVDARGTGDTGIAAETAVTGTTVSNRIERLAEDIVTGDDPELDDGQAGYPMRVPFICSVELLERSV